MAVDVLSTACLPGADQEVERAQTTSKAVYNPQDPLPVTHFLQLDPAF